MPTFPTLTAIPSHPLIEQQENSVIRSEFDAGYVQTRARYTRVRKTWQVSYHFVDNSDKAALDTFVSTVNGGADSFTWVNPQDSVSYTVRFQAPPTFSYVSYGGWDVSFKLEQV